MFISKNDLFFSRDELFFFSCFFAFVYASLGGNRGGVFILAFVMHFVFILFIYVGYRFLMKGCVFLYDRFIKKWLTAIKNEETYNKK